MRDINDRENNEIEYSAFDEYEGFYEDTFDERERFENEEFYQSEVREDEILTDVVQEEGTTAIVPSKRKTRTKSKRKKRRKKHYFLKFCIFVALCVAAYFVMHSSAFTVKKVKLVENEHMTKEQMQEVTGYKKGINLFEIDARKKEAKLEKDTYIKDADISRKLPDTIVVTLTLRQQTAVIASDKGYILIDDEGVVIDVLEQLPQYTVLSGLTVETAEKGEVVEVKQQKKYEQYMELLKEISAADMYFKTLSIDKNTITAYATDGLYCTGTIGNFEESMEKGNLQAIFYDLMQKGITTGVVNIGDDQYYSFGNQ